MILQHRPLGWIEVICGPMFSGKTEELIRRIRRASIARQRVAVFKPELDTRFSRENLVSHSRQKLECVAASSVGQILEQLAPGTQVVGIDEAQFFGEGLVSICEELANSGLRVIVAGLDQDYMGRPFEPMPQLLALAEEITKLLAICVRCGSPAGKSQRITSEQEQVVLGAGEHYEARCRQCFSPEQAMEEAS